MKPTGIAFDYDYTLGDSTKGILICANEALSRLGWPPFSAEQIQKTIGMSLKETYRALTGDPSPEHAQAYHLYFREKAQEVMAPNASFYPGAAELLKQLVEEGYLLGIVTSKQRLQIEKILQLHHLRPYFETVLGGDDVSAEKPDPEGLLRVQSEWKLQPQQLLYIGDSLVDAKTAQRAALPFVAVTTGVTPQEAFSPFPCFAILNSLQELLPFLESL